MIKGFSGATYVQEFDLARLTEQLKLVYGMMRDGEWRTVDELAQIAGLPNTRSVEAQLRNLRKPQFGGWEGRLNPTGHFVLRKNRDGIRGLSEYRLLLHRRFVRDEEPKSLLAAYDEEVAKASKNAPTVAPAPTRTEPRTDLFQDHAA